MPTNVIMPQLGESVVEGTVSKWLKREGDTITELEPLLEVNTDKVDTEVPAPASGVLLKLLVPEGTTVKVGTPIALIGQPGEEPSAISNQPSGANGHAAPPSPRPPSPVPSSGRQRDLGFISPVVAKLADEHKVDLYQIKGTGQGGRITKKDVLAFVETSKAAPAKTEAPAWEQVGDGDLFRPTELQFGGQGAGGGRFAYGQGAAVPPSSVTRPPLPATPSPDEDFIPVEGMRKLIAEHMVRSKQASPHVTTVFEADLSRVLAHLEKNQAAFERDGVKLTLTAYFIAAMVAAVKAVPLVNSQWTDDGASNARILLKREINIGMAVALEEGLIVPVLKRADEKSLLGLAREINDLAKRARGKALKADEVQGGTLTLTNHGVSGSLFATPIINQPQTAIVGAGKMEKRVVVINDAIAIRPMAYLTLTFDHRVLDGAVADRFMATMKKTLEEWG